MVNEVKIVPAFSEGESLDKGQGSVQSEIQPEVEETSVVKETEKETPSTPPVEEKPVSQPTNVDSNGPSGDSVLQNAVQSLQEERTKLLREIADLRGQRREIKQEQITQVEQQLEGLKDVHPDDVTTIEKVLRSKGYVPKQEVQKMVYDSIKDEELNRFLDKYPEYKPENDRNDLNWSSLQKELAFYRMPENPRAIGEVLLRAHRAISGTRIQADRSLPEKKRQVEIAGMGSGGTQRSSSSSTKLTSQQRRVYEDGGWSEEEIREIESKLQ